MQRGGEAEAAAERFLAGRGMRCVARNWRCRGGEIDLIMRDGGTLVFVEVRARRRGTFGGAAASIDRGKQLRLIHAASVYLAGTATPPPCRFDAVLFDGDRLTWLRDAFRADG